MTEGELRAALEEYAEAHDRLKQAEERLDDFGEPCTAEFHAERFAEICQDELDEITNRLICELGVTPDSGGRP